MVEEDKWALGPELYNTLYTMEGLTMIYRGTGCLDNAEELFSLVVEES